MVQFCYLTLYLDFETVSCRLLQRMARIGKDWNLFKMGPTHSNFKAMPGKTGISSSCGRVQSPSDVIKMIEKTVMNNIYATIQ